MKGMSRTPIAPPGSTPPAPVVVGGDATLTIEEVVAVARHDAPVRLAEQALARIRRTRAVVDALADDDEPHYGVSTGFGALATRHIPSSKRAQLQRSLVRSHAAGSGPEVEREVVRALMLLRLADARHRAHRRAARTAATYAALLNAGITPVVHEYGSLGCSGDLAPLAHCALAAMGEGPVLADATGELRGPRPRRCADHGIEPLELREKEGLALINGTDGMLGMLCLAIADLRGLLTAADVAAAMSVEGLLGTDHVFAADLQALRPHPGQAASAANMSPCWPTARSGLATTPDCPACRTPTRLRCAPQVHGAPGTPWHARGRGIASWLGHRQSRRHPRRRVEQRQLPRRAARPTSSTSSRSSPPTWRA
jgi:histidine ammonia-lyase